MYRKPRAISPSVHTRSRSSFPCTALPAGSRTARFPTRPCATEMIVKPVCSIFSAISSHNTFSAFVEDLPKRKCYHSGKGNFFTIELVNEQTGCQVEYEIYFAASRASKKGAINLFVQSDYVRDVQHQANRPRRKSIRFHIILFNVLNNIEIKIPK